MYIYHRTPKNIWNKFYAPLPYRERESREYIAFKESTDRYFVWNYNHTCYGRFQLNNHYYLHNNFSIVNQEKAADRYVSRTYGSWYNAAKMWHRRALESFNGLDGWY